MLLATTSTAGDSVALFLVLVFIGALYFVPTIIAALRQHKSIMAIGLVNFLFGWTILGWLFALIWSLANSGNSTIIVQQVNKP